MLPVAAPLRAPPPAAAALGASGVTPWDVSVCRGSRRIPEGGVDEARYEGTGFGSGGATKGNKSICKMQGCERPRGVSIVTLWNRLQCSLAGFAIIHR